MKVLTKEALVDRYAFDNKDSCCACHVNPPCAHCTDPGNPANQEGDEFWMDFDPDDPCPQCKSEIGVKFPREGTAYCEDCGWPDEDFGATL